jgi:photosystem II stability/assembly factor-like uncharacterized protein
MAASARSSYTIVPADAIFWNPQVGLLGIGRCGAGGRPCHRGRIELTTDGGRSYRLIHSTRDRITRLFTVGSRGAIAVTSTAAAQLTLDRGRTWKKVPFKPSIDWATPRIGLRAGIRSDFSLQLASTHDGGKTWRSLPNPCRNPAEDFTYASLPAPKRWRLLCEEVPQGMPAAKAIFFTRNAGRSWKPEASTANGGLSTRGSAGDIELARDGFGFLSVFGWVGGQTAYVTRNGGTTWTKLPSKLGPVAALTGGVGYAISSGRNPLPVTLVVTRDHGRTWQAVHRWGG